MSKNLSLTKRLVGYALIGLVWATLLVLLGFFSMVTVIFADLKLRDHYFWTRIGGVETITLQLYMDYFRPIWQHQANCMSFDEDLVYVPRVGVVRYHGPEFDTSITIKPDGLRHQAPVAAHDPLIAITGDSQAFGWGVNDEETFSAILAHSYHLHTANTAVPSYGTARELLRLRKLDILARASAVVIQYCENDADENHDFVADKAFIQKRGVHALWESLQHFNQNEVSYSLVTKSTYQFLRSTWKSRGWTGLAGTLLLPNDRATGQIADIGRNPSMMATDFLSVLDAFPELGGKTIFVLEVNGWGEKTNFILELRQRAAGRQNLIILEAPFVRSDFFRLDDHMNPAGHEKVAAILFEAIQRQQKRKQL